MARIRTIKPDFFRHVELFEAERDTKLPLRVAFAGLWTAADREGRFVWEPRTLKLDCLPYDDVDFSAVLDALWEYGFIVKYKTDEKTFGCIPSWKTHQHVNLREAQSNLPEPTDASTCKHVRARGERKGKEGKGKGRRIRTVAAATRPPSEDPFDEFWKVYPKRGKAANPKGPAKERFDRAVKSGVPPDEIVAAAKRYADAEMATGNYGTAYVAQAVTWLNQKRWQDYPANAAPESVISDAERDALFAKMKGSHDASRNAGEGTDLSETGAGPRQGDGAGRAEPARSADDSTGLAGVDCMAAVLPAIPRILAGDDATGGARAEPRDDGSGPRATGFRRELSAVAASAMRRA